MPLQVCESDPVVIRDADTGEFVAMTLPCEAGIATQEDYDRAALIVERWNACES